MALFDSIQPLPFTPSQVRQTGVRATGGRCSQYLPTRTGHYRCLAPRLLRAWVANCHTSIVATTNKASFLLSGHGHRLVDCLAVCLPACRTCCCGA